LLQLTADTYKRQETLLNTRKKRLLIVDDEPKIRTLLSSYLSKEGFDVTAVEDGVSLDRHLNKHHVDLVILDLMLPGEDGLSIGRRLRTQKNLPIIILSARGEELDRIVGLEMGADDYLIKPFNPRELLARVRSVLRRCNDDNNLRSSTSNSLTFGPFSLDIQQHRLNRGSQEIALTTGEFTLLRLFLEHPNRVLNRDSILEMTKGYEHSPLDRSIDVCVGRLRRKIEENPSEPVYLRTVWGSGYLFSNEN
jgi:DNA-binding response OmpR family regulator